MTIEEIIALAKGEQTTEAISLLKSHRYSAQPDVNAALKALDPKQHEINDPTIRKDKWVKVDSGDDGVNGGDETRTVVSEVDGAESTTMRPEKVARVALALQRLIVNRAVSFCFGNPILYNSTPEDEDQEMVVKALQRILYEVKSNSVNRKVGRAIFAFKECAEYWYVLKDKNSRYGFESDFKVRCALFSPAFGDTLYPYFDEDGDMVAFSRSFNRTDSQNKSVEYFETFTDKEHLLWVNGQDGYKLVEGFPKNITIGKIPIVFGQQPNFETEDVDKLIDRLELLLSNFADTNDYHAAPKIFVTGQINGWSKKGESGSVIEGEEGATMQYVSWQSAPEAVKLEIETLLKMIYTITQTPDISFDAVKGLGSISGVALKLLFMDAHLKVQDKREVFDDYLQRRVNVLLAYMKQMNTKLEKACDEIEIEPEIVPYMLTSEMDELQYWMLANGNKAVISQEESIEKAGISNDTASTLKKIREEETNESTFQIAEPRIDA